MTYEAKGGGVAHQAGWIVTAKNDGAGCWLAVLERDYHEPGTLSFLMVRDVAPAVRSWGEAKAAFLKIHVAAV